MNSPLIQLMLVRLREFYREPGVLFWSLLFPVLMAWGLGIAFNKKPNLIKTVALVENGQTTENEIFNYFNLHSVQLTIEPESGSKYYELSHGNESEGITKFKLTVVSWEEAIRMLKKGKVTLIINTKGIHTEYHFDKNNSEAQLAYLQLTSAIRGLPSTQTNSELKPMTRKGTRYVDFLVPGLIAMNLMMSTMWGVSYSLIEARTKKMLRRMVVTPMPKWEYVTSHFLARVLLCTVEAIIIYTFAWFYFDMEITGNLGALFAVFVSGQVAFFGLALLIASRTSKTQIGNGLINLIVMPMMICSGIFFSYHNFPDSVIPVIQLLPLTQIADSIRAIFIEGAGWVDVWKPIAILNSIGLFCFSIGLRYYKWY